MTNITIPNDVTTIGAQVFWGCSSLSAIYSKFSSADNRCLIVDGVLNSFAPYGLTSYTIPDGITKIGDYALQGYSSLRSITIPDSVTSIGSYALNGCLSLAEIYCKALTPPHLGLSALKEYDVERKIYVPAESVEAYKAAQGWPASEIEGYNFIY